MKNVKKLHCGFVALMAVFALAFAGCAQSADEEDNAALENPADANSGTDASADGTDSTDASGVKVLKAGDSVTVNVGESVTVKAEGKTTAEFTQSGLTITHKGDGVFEISAAATMSDTSVSVNFNDGTDSDDGIDITLYVYDPNYTLNITLDSAVAGSAASISIYAEGKEDDETEAALKQTVNATYTAGATSASAKLSKDKANSYKYFNNIEVTVKDSDGNEIDVETNPVYFCYTDTAFTGITVSEAVAEKTFTINFQGFTIPGGSVSGLKYSTAWANSSSEWAEDTIVTPTVTVAADGASATFTVAKTSEFYIDWTAVVVKDSSDNIIEINSGNTAANKWYSYAGNDWSNTMAIITSAGATLISSASISISSEGVYQLAISYDSIKDYTTVHVTLASITGWGEGSYSLPCLGTDSSTWKVNTAWVDAGAFVDDNVSSSTGGYYASISPSDYTGGVYITGKTGLAGTLVISGSN